jgi:2-polyprenyl-3-methyl-5-hydroxy-6-metoxy-1,4-benzoquinol methylase
MKGQKQNYLLEKVVGILNSKARGRVLDLGCGSGDYSKRIKDLGFKVVAADLDEERFKYRDEIEFKKCNLADKLFLRITVLITSYFWRLLNI